MRAILLALSVIVGHASGFAIRGERVDRALPDITEDSLSDALRVLEREKRRLDTEASYRDWRPSYYDNWNEDDVNPADDETEDEDDGEVSNDIANYLATLLAEEEKGQYDSPPDASDEDEFDSDEQTSNEQNDLADDSFPEEKVTIDELKDIFEDQDPKIQNKAKSKKLAMRKKKTPEVENSLLGDRERLSETLKAEKEKSKSKKSIPRSSIDLENLSTPQIQELLNEVDKIEMQEVLDRQNTEEASKALAGSVQGDDDEEEQQQQQEATEEPVSDEELEDVFGETNDSNDTDDVDEENSVDDEEDEKYSAGNYPLSASPNKEFGGEWVTGDDGDSDEGRIKRLAKRGDKSRRSVQMTYASKISRLLDIIGKLRLQNLLENKEIDSLADALDVATISQAEQSLGQLPQELKSLQKAIKIEESLQGENSELSEGDKEFLHDIIDELVAQENEEKENADSEMEDDYDAESLANEIKRSGVLDEAEEESRDSDDDRLGQWYEQPIVGQAPVLDDDQDELQAEKEEENEEAKELLEDLMERYQAEQEALEGGNPEDDTQEEEDELVEDYPEEEIPDEEGERSDDSPYQEAVARLFQNDDVDEATQQEIGEALALFSHNVEPWQRRELENRIRDYEQCSPLDSLTSDCSLADKLSIPLDDEARELCSRHEACYACGGDLEKAAGQCDAGYLAEALELCNGIEKCNAKADAFLRLLQYYHQYMGDPQPACEHQCVVDYIYGVAV